MKLISWPITSTKARSNGRITYPLSFSAPQEIRTFKRLLASGYRLFEWDLAQLQTELAKLGLNWQDRAAPSKTLNR
jgi:hypothetical protein